MPEYTRFHESFDNSSLPSSYRRILARLKRYPHSKIDDLVHQLSIPKRTVERALKVLKDAGRIKIRWGQRASFYNFPEPPSVPPPEPPSVPPPEPPLNRHLMPQNGGSEIPPHTPPYIYTSSISVIQSERNVDAAPDAAPNFPRKPQKISPFCMELLLTHPWKEQPQKAEEELRIALESATKDEIRQRHRQWCEYWAKCPPRFPLRLWRWFADGEWLLAPAAAKQTIRTHDDELQEGFERFKAKREARLKAAATA